MDRAAAFNILLRIGEEFEAARFCVSNVSEKWHLYLKDAKTSQGRAIELGDVQRCRGNLELTYFLRSFATFETILRDFWINAMGRITDPPINPPMDSVAAYRHIDPATLTAAHAIRRLRNDVMHRNLTTIPTDFAACSKALGKFLSWLPDRW